MASTSQPLTLTGTLRYPSADLIALGRLILVDYQSHLKAAADAADAADDNDDSSAYWEAEHGLGDLSQISRLLDRRRWMEEEKAKDGLFPDAKEMEEVNDLRQTEESLLIMGTNLKAEYVIPAAVKLRREKRSDPPEGGWENEDALLDLLEFISKNKHSGLFRATDNQQKN